MQKSKKNILSLYLKFSYFKSEEVDAVSNFEDRWVGFVLRYKITGFFYHFQGYVQGASWDIAQSPKKTYKWMILALEHL